MTIRVKANYRRLDAEIFFLFLVTSSQLLSVLCEQAVLNLRVASLFAIFGKTWRINMGCTISNKKPIAAPYPLASRSRREWVAWRNRFLAYMHEKSNIPVNKQASQFYQCIGNIGIDISKKFYFHNLHSEPDIDMLLFKFDVYFIFGGRMKHFDESIGDYIKALEVIAQKTAKNDLEKVIKEKILQDLNCRDIFSKFLKIVPSFSTIFDYEPLSLQELIFIWEEVEKSIKSSFYEDIRSKNSITDCVSCGSNHMANDCAARTAECSKCKNTGHFSWQCLTNLYNSCELCGQEHIDNQQECPANKHLCSICNKLGHFSFRCRPRRNSKVKH